MIYIRPAELADAKQIADLLREIGWFAFFKSEPPEITDPQVQKHLTYCLTHDSHTVYIAVDEPKQVVGYASVHWLPYLTMADPEGFVSELFIRESARGLGIGTKLLEQVKAEAQKRGCIRLSLFNMRNRESYQRGFYAQNGWQERPNAANFVYFFPTGA